MADFSESDVARLAQHVLNGRQIKNIVACTVSLAREQNTSITVARVESLLKILID